MKNLGFVLLLGLFIYAAFAPAPIPGVVYVIEALDHEQSPPASEMVEAAVQGGNLSMGVASKVNRAGGTVIYRGDRREVIITDDENQTYIVMNDSLMDAILGQVDEVKGEIGKLFENLPKEQREAIEEARRQGAVGLPGPMQPAAKPELKRTDERGEKEGYPCVKYEVLQGGEKVRELWVTDWSNLEGHEVARPTFEDFAAFLQELMESAHDKFQGGFDDSMFEFMKELGGFPVVTRDFDDGSLEGETTLRSARRQTIDPDAFEPPSGYKRQEMFGGR